MSNYYQPRTALERIMNQHPITQPREYRRFWFVGDMMVLAFVIFASIYVINQMISNPLIPAVAADLFHHLLR